MDSGGRGDIFFYFSIIFLLRMREIGEKCIWENAIVESGSNIRVLTVNENSLSYV